jgi:hypothetical protein
MLHVVLCVSLIQPPVLFVAVVVAASLTLFDLTDLI